MNQKDTPITALRPRVVATFKRAWRDGVLVLAGLGMLVGFMALEPVAQDPAYHDFADQRVLFGVPNLLDVASGVPFLFIGIGGILLCAGRHRPPLVASWSALFVAATLVCLGSGYYHWRPDDGTLFWDRLPMALAFMALFVALVCEHLGEGLERFLLVPALAVGLAGTLWWHYTDDLRLYGWVQFTPLVCIPLVLALFPGRYTHRAYVTYGLGLYAVAKLAELYDREVFALTAHAVSGHTLKHVLAAGALLTILLMLALRRDRP